MIANSPKKRIEFDPALFPVDIPTEIEDELLPNLQIPGILKNRFAQNSVTHLAHLRGLTPEEFLGWRGFGSTCMQALCSLLANARTGNIAKSLSARYEALSRNSLLPDILSFPFHKLNITSLLRSQLRHEFDINTVVDFLDAFEAEKFSRPGWGTRTCELVLAEIATLDRLGAEKYLSDVSLDTRSFLEIIHLIRQRLPSRELVILDHRFFPADGQFVTLDVLGHRLKLTRERVRQLEKALVRSFQSGKLREMGWLIRRKTLELFKEGVQEMRFEALLVDRFFAGVPITNYKGFAAFVFLDRVFYSTFTVKDDKSVLNKRVKHRESPNA